jgi:Uma2 family endonuclease
MVSFKPSVQQTDPPRPPRETLPTMYDLPSEDPQEPGLPDEYHYLQPQLLSLTFCSPNYPADQVFSAGDMNLYYTVQHPNWYKRPDWFGVVGVPRLYEQRDTRLSYVIWQEGIAPFIVVELLSPGTEDEDLGQTPRNTDRPPRKWDVYEQILRIPYYIIFDRYTDQLQAFALTPEGYQSLELPESKLWIPNLQMGLGLWKGDFRGIDRLWLRWYDTHNQWIPTDAEALQLERQRANAEQQRADRLAEKLRALGVNPDEL